jgi:uncharacterized delta-60 repeat protein
MRRPSNRERAVLLVLIALASAWAAAPRALADGHKAGALDPSFGKGGRVVAKAIPEALRSEFSAAATEPDGDLVFVLTHQILGGEFVKDVEMRTPAGALVPSFGEGGRVVVEAGGGIATLPDGDILVGVTKCDGNPSSVLMLDPSGAPVAGFGSGGCGAAVKFPSTFVTADAEGRILVAGERPAPCPSCSKGMGPPFEAVFARLMPDGSLDLGFGDAGEVATEEDLHLVDESSLRGVDFGGLVAAPQGKVTIGTSEGLIRLDQTGALDTGYGDGGVANPEVPTGDLKVAADGSVVAIDSANDSLGVSRFGPEGKLDPSFGDAGTAKLSLPPESSLSRLVVEPGGGILLAGQEGAPKGSNPYDTTPFLERFTAAGGLDPAFGDHGIVKLNLPTGGEPDAIRLAALLLTPTGSAIVTGNDRGQSAAAVAVTAAGSPDPSFGEGGTLVEEVTQPAQLEPTGLALMPSGKLELESRHATKIGVATGYLTSFGRGGRQLAAPDGAPAVETPVHGPPLPIAGERVAIRGRTLGLRHILRGTGAGGGPVRGYGTSGVARLPIRLKLKAVEPAPGGGALAVGEVEGKMAAYRVGPKGRPVRGFGAGGLATVAFPSGSATAATGLVEADGDVVLSGSAGERLGVARLLPDGGLDRGFGHGGRVVGPLGDNASGDRVASLDGGLVIAAAVEKEAAGLVRLDSHGRLDRGFGRGGVLRGGRMNSALAVFAAAGRIVVVTDPGGEKGYSGSGVELRAYKLDGTVARGFGRHGVAVYGGGEKPRLFPVAAVQQPDGKIVVAATASERPGGETKAELLRFLLR